MKKTLLITLAAALLVTSFASCSRRGQYKDQLDSMKDTQPEIPLEEQTAKDGFIGSPSEDYALPIIKKTGETPYFSGKTEDELKTLWLKNEVRPEVSILPTGKVFGDTYYNKLTGNMSKWCADPLCECDSEDCIWAFGYSILYVSHDWLYFSVDNPYHGIGLYRCDHRRNNIEFLYEIPSFFESDGLGGSYGYAEAIESFCEVDGKLYFAGQAFESGKGSLFAWKVLDLATKEVSVLYTGKSDQFVEAIIDGDVYYHYGNQEGTKQIIYKTDLSFEAHEEVFKAMQISSYNDTHIVLRGYVQKNGYNPYYLYDISTGQMTELPGGGDKYNFKLSGNYVYYQDRVMGEELTDDPFADYYSFTWKGNKTARTDGAGKLYRMNIATGESECVLQLTYKDVPVRIEFYEPDGEVIYVSFRNHEEFENFYNHGEFDESVEYDAHSCVVDLQRGTLTFLNFSDEV